jgi:hypothetical protein
VNSYWYQSSSPPIWPDNCERRLEDERIDLLQACKKAADETGVWLDRWDGMRKALDVPRFREILEYTAGRTTASSFQLPMVEVYYISVLLRRPGIGQRLLERTEELLGPESRARLHQLRNEGFANVAPVGLSVFVRSRVDDGAFRVLLTSRSGQLPVLPNCLQPTVDEGLSRRDNYEVIAQSLEEELGISGPIARRLAALTLPSVRSSSGFFGFYYGGIGTSGIEAESPCNLVFEIVLTSETFDLIHALVAEAIDRDQSARRELSGCHVITQFLSGDHPRDMPDLPASALISHYLRETCDRLSQIEGDR